MEIRELVSKYDQAVKLEQGGALEEAFQIYMAISKTERCPKSLAVSAEKAASRLESKLVAPPPVPQETVLPPPTPVEDTSFVGAMPSEVDTFFLRSIPSIEGKMPISNEDYERMKEDIGKRGIQIPLIALPDGRLLCGYNRLKIAKELGIKAVPVIFRQVPEVRLLEFAVKDNVMRRQLSSQQIIDYVSLVFTHTVGRPKKGSRDKTAEEIAKTLGVTKKTVLRARAYTKKVAEKPELQGRSIREVVDGGEKSKHLTLKYPFTMGVDDEKIEEYLMDVIDKIYDMDMEKGAKALLLVQVFCKKDD